MNAATAGARPRENCSAQEGQAHSMDSIVAEFWDALERDMPGKATSMVEGGHVSPHLRDRNKVPVLMHAAGRGYADLVKALLDKNAVPDERDANDQGPLFLACMAGKPASGVAALRRAAAAHKGQQCATCSRPGYRRPSPTAQRRRCRPLWWRPPVAIWCVDALWCDGLRLLTVSRRTKHQKGAIHELLQSGAGLDECDAQGHTALHTACFTGSPAVALFLIEKGANCNLRSKKGALPLAWAAAKARLQRGLFAIL